MFAKILREPAYSHCVHVVSILNRSLWLIIQTGKPFKPFHLRISVSEFLQLATDKTRFKNSLRLSRSKFEKFKTYMCNVS